MSYTPTNWQCGDTVTADKLNKMEQGIANAGSGGGESVGVSVPNLLVDMIVRLNTYRNTTAVNIAAGDYAVVRLNKYSGEDIPIGIQLHSALRKVEIQPFSSYSDLVLMGVNAESGDVYVVLKNVGNSAITVAANAITMNIEVFYYENIDHTDYCLVMGSGCSDTPINQSV